MKFSELAQYFDKLDETSSRLALIDILSDLFKSVKTGEQLEKICYLVQGRVAPFFEPIEFGMADKMIAQALAATYGEEKEAVLKQYGKLGDISLVAYEFAEKHKHGSELTVDQVFVALNEIASTSGAGSVEKKTTFLKDELLEKLTLFLLSMLFGFYSAMCAWVLVTRRFWTHWHWLSLTTELSARCSKERITGLRPWVLSQRHSKTMVSRTSKT